jgi:hypothetical protein
MDVFESQGEVVQRVEPVLEKSMTLPASSDDMPGTVYRTPARFCLVAMPASTVVVPDQ